ncbi:MAG TPA: dihydroneopterin aldolase [Caulobacteraceae bacterium]|nr:dihydroneopterin aldolase [Caulobacteraceae bacterium]
MPSQRGSLHTLTVFVRGLRLQAEVGLHAHEQGRRQPLIVDVELELAPTRIEHIATTVNYDEVAHKAKALAAAGHCNLVETFAHRLAEACLEDDKVRRVRVRIEKPEALAPDAEAAGVEVVMGRE